MLRRKVKARDGCGEGEAGSSLMGIREGLADIEVSRKEMRVYAKLGRVFLAE